MSEFWQNFSTLIMASSFGVGLISGLHCLGMCGPIMAQVNSQKSSLFLYHLFRLLSYVIITLIFSYTGHHLLHVLSGHLFLAAAITITLAATILFLVRKKTFLIQGLIFKNIKNKAAALGLMSGFLPCGPLYAVILGTGLLSPYNAIGYITLFWLGTLPLLFCGNWILARLKEKTSIRFPVWSNVIVWGLFLFLAIQRISLDLATAGQAPTCH